MLPFWVSLSMKCVIRRDRTSAADWSCRDAGDLGHAQDVRDRQVTVIWEKFFVSFLMGPGQDFCVDLLVLEQTVACTASSIQRLRL